MVCGVDSIDNMDLLRHGGMRRLFDGVRAPSTLGTFLRVFTFGHVRQLDAVAAGLLVRLATATPVLPEADQMVFVDLDDTVRRPTGMPSRAPDVATPASRASTRSSRSCPPRCPRR